MDDKIDFSCLEKEIDLFKTNFDGLDIGSNQLIFVSSIVIPYLEQLIKLVRPNDFTKLQLKQLYDISKKFLIISINVTLYLFQIRVTIT